MTIHGTKIWGILFLALSLTVGLPNLSFAGYADDLTPEQFEKFTKDQKDMGNISQSTETQKDVNLDAMYGDGIGAWFGKTFYKGVAGIAWVIGHVGGSETADAAYYHTLKGIVWTDAQLNALLSSASFEEVNAYLEEKVLVEKEMFEDASGKKWVVVKNKDGENYSANYASEGNWKGCEVLPVKLYRYRQCFFCPLFSVIYVAADKMATISMTKLAGAFATLIALGLGLWIAVQTLAHVSSLTKQDAPKFLGNLLKQSFKFIIAFLLLNYVDQVYTYIINPLLIAGLGFGKELLFITDSAPITQGNEVLTTYYTSVLYGELESFIAQVQQEIAFMQAIGSSLMCIGGHKMVGIGGFDFGNGFQMAIQGFLLAAFGLLLSLAFGFYLIDAVVQLGIIGALMPFLIACWPFKLTAGYTAKGFSMLLNSFFVFVFIGLVVSVNIQLVDTALMQTAVSDDARTEKAVTLSAEQEKRMTELCSSNKVQASTGQLWRESAECKNFASRQDNLGALQLIYDAINTQDDNKLKELTDISTLGFIILIICCIFGFKFCGQASALADKMAGGGMKNLGVGVGTMGYSAALSAGKKVTQPVREAASNKIKEGGEKLWRGITSTPGRLRSRFNTSGGQGGNNEIEGDDNENLFLPADSANEADGSGTSSTAQNGRRPTIAQNAGRNSQRRNSRSATTGNSSQTQSTNRFGGSGSTDGKPAENPNQETVESEVEVEGETKVENANTQQATNGNENQTAENSGNAADTAGAAAAAQSRGEKPRAQRSAQEKANRTRHYQNKLSGAKPREQESLADVRRNKSKGGSNKNNAKLAKQLNQANK